MNDSHRPFLEAFAASTAKTLRMMCGTEAERQPEFQKGSKPQPGFDVAGLIGMTGASTRGSAGIFFPKDVFLKLISSMLGEELSSINKDNEGAAAELMNIIFGDVKAELNQRGHALKMAIPCVVRGTSVVSPGSKLQRSVVLPFTCPAGPFYIELSLSDSGEAAESAPGKSNALDNAGKAAFFKPFVAGTISTLKVLCGIDANPGSPSIKTTSDANSFDIAGVIGITSGAISGSYSLSFKKDVFLKLISKMLGEEFTELQPGLEDGVSELLNITLGHAKVTLNEQGHNIQMALPSLVYGDQIRSSFQKGSTTIIIPFYSDVGRFTVEVTLD